MKLQMINKLSRVGKILVNVVTTTIRKKKHKPYEEISGKFKKIRHPVFNGEIETREEAKS